MSSALNLRPNDYVTSVMLTAVGYDYILTFSNELEYIWRRPWTQVSVLFILVRYVGIYSLVASSLVGSSFLPGPVKVYVSISAQRSFYTIHGRLLGHIIGLTNDWAFCLFFGAADFVMLLRVWALYNRSRLILGTLLALFFLEIIYIIVPTALYSTYPTYIPAAVANQKPNCAVVLPPVTTKVGAAIQIVNGTALCTLVIIQFVMQSLQMYRITKRLQINRYVGLIVKQGILYYLVTFLRMANILHAVAFSSNLPRGGWQLMLLAAVQYVPMFTLLPRFTISIRELYARDVRTGIGEGIDTGFGLSSSIQGTDGTGMVFADVERSDGLDGVEETVMDLGPTQPV